MSVKAILILGVIGAAGGVVEQVMLFLTSTPAPPSRWTGAAPDLLGRNGSGLLVSCPKPRFRRDKLGAVGIVINGSRPASGGRQIYS